VLGHLRDEDLQMPGDPGALGPGGIGEVVGQALLEPVDLGPQPVGLSGAVAQGEAQREGRRRRARAGTRASAP
jgi:hypothetical protein